jgi:molybdenum cofactor cytidylyltransferase
VDVVTGIIMASGFSRRMEDDKLLLQINGLPMVEHVVKASHSSLIDEIILIYRNKDVQEIGKRYGFKTVFNPHPKEGQSEAIKLGIAHAPSESEGYMFLVGDQPYLSHATINRLIEVFNRDKHCIIIPVYSGARGNPVIFPACLKKELLDLEGDCGGRRLAEGVESLVKLVPIEDGLEGMDIDTREVYETIQDR